ncbi:hypothetical protein, partial [Methylomagnum sp.]
IDALGPSAIVWTGAKYIVADFNTYFYHNNMIRDYYNLVASPDGINWTLITSGRGRLSGLAWNGKRFVSVGYPKIILGDCQ